MKQINTKYLFAIAVFAATIGFLAAAPAGALAYGYYHDYNYGYGNYGYYSPTAITNAYTPAYAYQPTQTVYVQPQPTYYPQQTVYVQPTGSYYNNYNNNGYYNYGPLSVSCSAATSYSSTGAVSWSASATGGNGYYSYSWTGSDGLYGSGQNLLFNYVNTGLKTASVTVYSGGQTITQGCSNAANVTGVYSGNYPIYQQPVYAVNSYPSSYATTYSTSASNSLDIGCYADPASAKVNQPVTWNTEVTGGATPYAYSWTGSDGLSGSQSSVIKYYDTVGSKNAIVTVTSADGKTGTRSCSNTVTVSNNASASSASGASSQSAAGQSSAAKASASPSVSASPSPSQSASPSPSSSELSAASLFSLTNVPWGWVAVLVIIVLFVTVVYLMFNKQKI